MMWSPFRLAVAVALTLVGCKVDVPPLDDANARFACNEDNDCADGHYCFHELGTNVGYCQTSTQTDDPCMAFPCQNGHVCTVNEQHQPVCEQCRYVANSCGDGFVCVKSSSTTSSLCVPSCGPVDSDCVSSSGSGRCVITQGYPSGNDVQGTVQVCASCAPECTAAQCYYPDNTDNWEQAAQCTMPPVSCSPYGTGSGCGSDYCLGTYCAGTPTLSCSTGCSGGDICGDDDSDGSYFCRSASCASGTCPNPYTCDGSQCVYTVASSCPAVPCIGEDVCVAGSCRPPFWYQLGSSVAQGIPSTSNVESFDMALDSGGNPVIAWVASGWLYMTRWVPGSGAWSSVATATFGSSSFPSIALDAADRPVIAWQQSTDGIWVKYYDTTTGWTSYTQGTFPTDSAVGFGIAISPMAPAEVHTPQVVTSGADVYVAWRELDASNPTRLQQVYLRRWDATSALWTEISGSASNLGISSSSTIDATHAAPSLAVQGSDVVVGWYLGGNLQLSRSTAGGPWTALSTLVFTGYTLDGLGLAFDKSNRPAAALSYWTGSAVAIEAWYFNSSAYTWVSTTQLLNTTAPSLARDASGNLALAYTDMSTASPPTYFTANRDDAMGWVEIDGSRTNDGVSIPAPAYTRGPTYAPVVAAAPTAGGRLCVAWIEYSMIRLRCHSGL